MTDSPTPTPPPSVQIPAWVPPLFTFLLAAIKNPFLHTILTILGSSYGMLFLAKQSLPSGIGGSLKDLRPHIIKPPKKAEDAIGKIIFGNSGCTATIIGPVSTDDRELSILTAAHCVKVGALGTMSLKDGRTLKVKCVSRDDKCDAAWLTAENPGGDVPYMLLADGPPQDGEIVWHQGYGIDRPGNRESGVFRGVQPDGQQCRFRLSVSPGDSGGGIILDSESRVISPVCCTTKMAAMGDVFGASPNKAAAIRPKRRTEAADDILYYPVLPLPDVVFSSVPEPPVLRPRQTAGDK